MVGPGSQVCLEMILDQQNPCMCSVIPAHISSPEQTSSIIFVVVHLCYSLSLLALCMVEIIVVLNMCSFKCALPIHMTFFGDIKCVKGDKM